MTASSVLALCHKRNSWDFCAGFCPRAASGQAAAAPPSSVMNARRLLSNMELPAPWVTGGPKPFAIVPERPSLHEVTISHGAPNSVRAGCSTAGHGLASADG
jgi:hypothetical protein